MQIKVIEKRNLWFAFSLTIIIAGILLMGARAINNQPTLNFGIDFTGGSSFILGVEELSNRKAASPGDKSTDITFIEETRTILNNFGLEKSVIQISSNNELLIRTIQLTSTERIDLLKRFEAEFGVIELLEADIIGPTIGEELKQQSGWIIAIVTLALLLYITWRFEFFYAAAALAALIHDSLIIISFAAFLNIEVNTAFVAALLTVLGYSINDTIVIFDRIRETLRTDEKHSLIVLINAAISQMMSRSIHTSITTIIVITSLLIFGGTTIKAFSLVLLIGIIAGTYSSILIASPVLFNLLKKNDQTN